MVSFITCTIVLNNKNLWLWLWLWNAYYGWALTKPARRPIIRTKRRTASALFLKLCGRYT